MNINSVDASGAMNGAPITVDAPGKMGSTPQVQQTAAGNGGASAEQVKKMVEVMQDHLDSMNISLQYSMYGNHGEKIAIKVVNKGTGDVIREFPPKELQALQSKMSELVGMIFSGKG